MLLETDVSSDVHPQLSRFLSGMRKGAQALTYLDLRKMWSNLPFPYRQVCFDGPPGLWCGVWCVWCVVCGVVK